jgi:hypothetical protein
MFVSEFCDNRHQHWESLLLVGLENVKEVIILEETHSSVSYLEMDSSNATDDTLEKAGYQMFNFVNFAYFKHFLQLSKEKGLLDTVGERPVS